MRIIVSRSCFPGHLTAFLDEGRSESLSYRAPETLSKVILEVIDQYTQRKSDLEKKEKCSKQLHVPNVTTAKGRPRGGSC